MLNFIPQTTQNGEATYLVELEVDRLVDDTVRALADLLEELEPLTAGLLLSVKLLLRFGGFSRVFACVDALADVGVSVSLHVGVLASSDVPARGLANQAQVFVELGL